MPTDGTVNCKSEYYSFLLRIWYSSREDQDKWRVTLENIVSDEKHIFSDIEALVTFILQLPYQVINLDHE